MPKLKQLLAPRCFVAHGADRVPSLEGRPLASFRARSIAFAVDLLIFNLLLAAGSILWAIVGPDHAPC
jgi:hypothetical protein